MIAQEVSLILTRILVNIYNIIHMCLDKYCDKITPTKVNFTTLKKAKKTVSPGLFKGHLMFYV